MIPTEQQMFERYMASLEKSYDPQARMVSMWRGENGYHSRLTNCTVHPVSSTFPYAFYLLNRDDPGDRERASGILYRCLSLQEVDPSVEWYGIWPYYLEERLEQMNPADWNMADFSGKMLLRTLMYHSDKLSDDLKMRMRDAVGHACRSIIRRDVQPVYTNVAVMDAYVLLVAGEMFGREDLFTDGKRRLEKMYRYNTDNGSFSEFNSPCYTFLTIGDLCDLSAEVRDPECVRMAERLCDMAWETIAVHFHPATGQLAGPHFRAYRYMLADETKYDIERALGGRIRLITDYDRLTDGAAPIGNCRCPEKFMPYFTDRVGERILDQTFGPSLMAYTYMNDRYTLGSIHLEKLWNQHRNVLGYAGTVDAPYVFNLKCMHDGWDFCSCQSATVQKKGKLLSVLGFLTDAGDTHVTLDMVKDATISAEELKISWAFVGAVDRLSAAQTAPDEFTVTDADAGLTYTVRLPYAVFGELPVIFELNRGENELEICAVLYRGERRDICLRGIDACVVTAFEVTGPGETPAGPAVCTVKDGGMDACFDGLRITAPLGTDLQDARCDAIRFFRDGEPYVPAY